MTLYRVNPVEVDLDGLIEPPRLLFARAVLRRKRFVSDKSDVFPVLLALESEVCRICGSDRRHYVVWSSLKEHSHSGECVCHPWDA